MRTVKGLGAEGSPYDYGYAYCGASKAANHPDESSRWISPDRFVYSPNGAGPRCPCCGVLLRTSPRRKTAKRKSS